MNSSPSFPACFEALTGYRPLRWQRRLFEQISAGAIPSACDLPTGLGKTSVIPIWLIAVAWSADASMATQIPRRLVYVANRRTIVDQATDVVERMRERLRNPEALQTAEQVVALDALKERLENLSSCAAGGGPFAVSTLRGELADNEEWMADPARPAIIVDTLDMIGSKLLFSGYGDGSYQRVHQAGLIGQDVLIVHDEARLTPAFSDLLQSISNAQKRARAPRPARVLELSATKRRCTEVRSGGDILELEAEDESDDLVVQRLNARKFLRLHDVGNGNLPDELARLAARHEESASKILIYVREPKRAQLVKDRLRALKGKDCEASVALLSGTMRGYERDQFVCSDVMRPFLEGRKPHRSVYLISTSAGEVGIDLDADHIVSDLTTLDALVQRLGRVNRRGGEGRVAQVDIVVAQDDAEPEGAVSGVRQAVDKTCDILRRWAEKAGGELDSSPRSLRALVNGLPEAERESAFSPRPPIRPLTDVLLDAWSLTSIDDLPGRPEVAAYLHGLSQGAPETYVAWRSEIRTLGEAGVEAEALRDWFRAFRIRPRERLRDRTDHIKRSLLKLLQEQRKKRGDKNLDLAMVVLNERGEARWEKLSGIARRGPDLEYKTLVLPVEAGGLDEHGMLDAKVLEPAKDVAEEACAATARQRWICTVTTGGERWRRLLTGEEGEPGPHAWAERERIILSEQSEGSEDEVATKSIVSLIRPGELALTNPGGMRFRQTLAEHTGLVVYHAGRIADRLGLGSELKDALVLAAKWHDCGKTREIWQRYACDSDGEPLAKSTKYRNGRELCGYRHEFGSVLEAAASNDLRDHPHRELVLHLIAAHHGHARPHFQPGAFNATDENAGAIGDVMRRFDQLQHRFGRWGLAWLESLLRCADIAASQPGQ